MLDLEACLLLCPCLLPLFETAQAAVPQFLYLHQSFCPSLEETVGVLYQVRAIALPQLLLLHQAVPLPDLQPTVDLPVGRHTDLTAGWSCTTPPHLLGADAHSSLPTGSVSPAWADRPLLAAPASSQAGFVA